MGYQKYWKLSEKPFEEVCNTRFFFESDDHREALDRMLYVVNDRNMNMGLLTGEVGCGKTITKNVFESSLAKNAFEVVSFENSSFQFLDIIFDICKRMSFRDARLALTEEAEVPGRNDKYQLMNLFKKKLETLVYEEKRHLVLVFDEAQQMAAEVLDEVKKPHEHHVRDPELPDHIFCRATGTKGTDTDYQAGRPAHLSPVPFEHP